MATLIRARNGEGLTLDEARRIASNIARSSLSRAAMEMSFPMRFEDRQSRCVGLKHHSRPARLGTNRFRGATDDARKEGVAWQASAHTGGPNWRCGK
jgi:hypothetical protein